MAETAELVSVEEFLESNAGSRYHEAILLAEIGSHAEAVYEEFRYMKPEERPFPPEVFEAVKTLAEFEFRV